MVAFIMAALNKTQQVVNIEEVVGIFVRSFIL